jgi:hypothetical protein
MASSLAVSLTLAAMLLKEFDGCGCGLGCVFVDEEEEE